MNVKVFLVALILFVSLLLIIICLIRFRQLRAGHADHAIEFDMWNVNSRLIQIQYLDLVDRVRAPFTVREFNVH